MQEGIAHRQSSQPPGAAGVSGGKCTGTTRAFLEHLTTTPSLVAPLVRGAWHTIPAVGEIERVGMGLGQRGTPGAQGLGVITLETLKGGGGEGLC
eukprot:TRINITY_DN1774_c2_g1_i1.p4 TRINITY_DN1774_c2_g1~~TRINITY_DN1774_c2_g1_i1.p4  ORF type:complete len:109 (-),score=0.73 TRINITY_DN1774_c2_g1_i1:835-1119(-)